VLPPFLVFKTSAMNPARHHEVLGALGARLDTAMQTTPIAYRNQNHGDYLIPELTLKPGLSADKIGFALHRSDEIASNPVVRDQSFVPANTGTKSAVMSRSA
jgi:NAD(P)H dehydrogenase (quinone)